VGVEVVHVGALDATAVASPGVGVAVKAAVEKVQGLVGEGDVAMAALPIVLGEVAAGRFRFGEVFRLLM